MRASDAPAVARLGAELGYPMMERETEERMGALLGEPGHCVLVAERDGAVVGWVHAHDRRLLQSPAEVEIAGLVVTAGARRGGVGALLVSAVEGWARDHGHDRVRVRSNVTRDAAHEFYPTLGFVAVKVSRVYLKQL
jgi:GNAT superfamily N-acetyltransferase